MACSCCGASRPFGTDICAMCSASEIECRRWRRRNDPHERALLRIRGARWSDIVRMLGLSEEAARQRWTALRRRVQQELRDVASGQQTTREVKRT